MLDTVVDGVTYALTLLPAQKNGIVIKDKICHSKNILNSIV